jgi:hypothetical protein
MIDKFVWLTPLLLLPILLLFAFVGCALQSHGKIPEPTLIIHPDVFGTRNIVSFTVTFDLKSNSTFWSNQVSKTVTSWTKTDSQDQVTLPWSQNIPANDNGPYTVSCAVMLVDNNDYHSPVTPVQDANLTIDNLEAGFELKPDNSNSFADFTLVIAS